MEPTENPAKPFVKVSDFPETFHQPVLFFYFQMGIIDYIHQLCISHEGDFIAESLNFI